MENAAQPGAKPTWLVLCKAGLQLVAKAGPAAFANTWGLEFLQQYRPGAVSTHPSLQHNLHGSMFLT